MSKRSETEERLQMLLGTDIVTIVCVRSRIYDLCNYNFD